MKKLLTFALALVLIIVAFPCVTLAEGIDVTAMDYDQLFKLKQQIDAEFVSRPESKPFILVPGEYEVGKDIRPGRYYILAATPIYGIYRSCTVFVYQDREAFDKRMKNKEAYIAEYELGNSVKSVDLPDGSFIVVKYSSVALSNSEFTFEDVYSYTVPDGTLVPAGRYVVGVEIPAGTYNFYAGTGYGGRAYVYTSEEDSLSDGTMHGKAKIKIEVDPSTHLDDYETAILEDGLIVVVNRDVVMRKQQKLNFE